MSTIEKIYKTIVVQRKAKTAAQLAAQYKTTQATVRARISDLRNHGFDIKTVQHTNTRGQSKSLYTM